MGFSTDVSSLFNVGVTIWGVAGVDIMGDGSKRGSLITTKRANWLIFGGKHGFSATISNN